MYARLDKDAPESQKLKYEPAKNTTLVHPPRDARTKEARKKREQIKAKIKTKTANKEVVTKKPKSQELKEFKENFTKMLQSSQGKRLGRPPLKEQPQTTTILWEPQAGFQVNVLASAEFEVLAGGGRGPLVYGETVLTPSGFKPIEDVSVGDKVITPANTEATIVAIPFDGEDHCYRVTFIDGRSVLVGQDHIWHVYTPGGRKGNTPYLTTTTKIQAQLQQEAVKTHHKTSVLVPLTQPIDEYQSESLPLEPYFLGLLLGDGYIGNTSLKLTTTDQEIIDYAQTQWDVHLMPQYNDVVFRKNRLLYSILESLGVAGKVSNSKFVPFIYKHNTVENKLAILQGLMDTDGTVDKLGHVSFCSVSKQLALDVQELVRSLGGKATISTKATTYTNGIGEKVSGQLAYNIYITMPDNTTLFRLSRKRARCVKGFNGSSTSVPKLRVLSVDYVGIRKCKCITLDTQDGLFLTNDYIVTHNSGKTDTLLVDPLRFISNRNFKGLIVRRTMPALREIISRAKGLYPRLFPGTKWKEQEKLFEFPSGATLEFGYFDHEDDYDRYHGRQFCWLGVDEITQWESQEYYDKLKSTVRRIDNTLPVRVRATCNPSGPGREWVKNYFNIETSVKDKVTKTELRTPEGPIVISRRYILSNVFDNRKLLEANPEYLAYLESLPEIQRRQWLEGDFEANEGMAFEDFARSTHVIKPFNIPNNWVKFRCIDWGYSSRSLAVCLWIAISNNGEAIVYRELAVNKMLASEFARKVLEISSNEYISYSVVDGSVGDKRGSSSPSIDEEFRNEGLICIYADKSPGSRIAGKQLIHKYLRTVDEESKPLLQIFDTCKQIIKELSSLPLDKHNPEDVDTTCEDHAYDALRYGLQSRPNPQLNKSFDQDFFGFGYRNHQRPGLNIVTPPIIDRRFGY
jgi:hypothetical protein